MILVHPFQLYCFASVTATSLLLHPRGNTMASAPYLTPCCLHSAQFKSLHLLSLSCTVLLGFFFSSACGWHSKGLMARTNSSLLGMSRRKLRWQIYSVYRWRQQQTPAPLLFLFSFRFPPFCSRWKDFVPAIPGVREAAGCWQDNAAATSEKY